jgi:small subunit ribosomal protein S8
MYNDPIADMLTRLRNASAAKHSSVVIPFSKLKAEIADTLKKSGYIDNVEISGKEARKDIIVTLGKNQIFLKRISSPGQRIYKNSKEIHPIKSGYGSTIITTSQGIMTDKEARSKKLGGEVICEIY